MGSPEQLAKKLRDRAEECHRITGMFTQTTDRLPYLRLAEAYENLAAQEELALGCESRHVKPRWWLRAEYVAWKADGERGAYGAVIAGSAPARGVRGCLEPPAKALP